MYSRGMIRIAAAVIPLLLCTCAQEVKREYDSRVENFLGRAILDIVNDPDRVQTFRLNPKRGAKPTGKKIDGTVVTAQGPDLTRDQINRLASLLNDPSSYWFEAVKGCKFSPGIAILFQKDDAHLGALLRKLSGNGKTDNAATNNNHGVLG